MRTFAAVFLAIIATASAFQRMSPIVRGKFAKAPLMATPWEDTSGEVPPSSVLGIGATIPSSVFGAFSIVALLGGIYSIHESNILNQVTATSINPIYVAGNLLVPFSWGAHVAAWIQTKNGK